MSIAFKYKSQYIFLYCIHIFFTLINCIHIFYYFSEANKSICKFSWITKSKKKVVKKKRRIASASTALLFGTILGLIQTAVLIFAAKPLLRVMGVKPVRFFLYLIFYVIFQKGLIFLLCDAFIS